MKSVVLMVALVLAPLTSQAQGNPQLEKYVSTMKEMNRLVSANSMSRQFLYCAVLSSNLHNYDMYGMFVRKAAADTRDADALPMALAYMMGFFESEVLNLKDSSTSTEDAAKVLGTLYTIDCMKYTLPGQS